MPQVRDSQHIVESVQAAAEPIVRALGLELVDVQCAGQAAGTIIRVFIDKPGGITVDDCERVHVSLGHALDVADPVAHRYTLEVSSPGLDRPLRTREAYRRVIGKAITVKLRQPHEGQWRLGGQLMDVDDNGLVLAPSGMRGAGELRLAWDAVAEARLQVRW
jgi:ribosome maturation factor RimP